MSQHWEDRSEQDRQMFVEYMEGTSDHQRWKLRDIVYAIASMVILIIQLGFAFV